jgi:hypothetical protein
MEGTNPVTAETVFSFFATSAPARVGFFADKYFLYMLHHLSDVGAVGRFAGLYFQIVLRFLELHFPEEDLVHVVRVMLPAVYDYSLYSAPVEFFYNRGHLDYFRPGSQNNSSFHRMKNLTKNL